MAWVGDFDSPPVFIYFTREERCLLNNSVYNISLDLHTVGSQLCLNVKLYDTAREIHCTLTENGKPYVISDGCYAVFTAKKPDGNVLYNATSIRDAIIYEFTVNTVNAPGEVECELRLYDSSGKLITSPRFTILVDDTVYHDGDAVESSSEFTALTDLMADVIRVLGDVPSPVLYGQEQELTDEQKAQARANIGAVDKGTPGPQGPQGVPGSDADVPDWAKQPEKPGYQANEIDCHMEFLGEEVRTVDDALAVAEDAINDKLDKPEVLTWNEAVYPTLLDFLKTITVPGRYTFEDSQKHYEYELRYVDKPGEGCYYYGELVCYDASDGTVWREIYSGTLINEIARQESMEPATAEYINRMRKAFSVVLYDDGWTEDDAGYTQTLTNIAEMSGITQADDILLQCCPAPQSIAACNTYGVQCVDAASGTLTFRATTHPAQNENISVVVAMWR